MIRPMSKQEEIRQRIRELERLRPKNVREYDKIEDVIKLLLRELDSQI